MGKPHSQEKNMQKNFLLKTADFAKICNTTKETIFHYDKINLLKPCYVAENGYRYYALTQSDQFYAVRELQSLGLSLQEIKEKLHSESPLQHFALIKTISAELEKKIRQLRQNQKTLSGMLHDLENYLQNKTCYAEELPKSSLITLHSLQKQDPTEYIHAYLKLIQNNPDFIRNSFCAAGIKRKLGKPVSAFDCELYYFRKAAFKKSDLPKNKFLIAFHDKKYDDIPQTYQQIFQFAQKNQVHLTAQSYEEILFNPVNIRENNCVIKIMVQLAE